LIADIQYTIASTTNVLDSITEDSTLAINTSGYEGIVDEFTLGEANSTYQVDVESLVTFESHAGLEVKVEEVLTFDGIVGQDVYMSTFIGSESTPSSDTVIDSKLESFMRLDDIISDVQELNSGIIATDNEVELHEISSSSTAANSLSFVSELESGKVLSEFLTVIAGIEGATPGDTIATSTSLETFSSSYRSLVIVDEIESGETGPAIASVDNEAPSAELRRLGDVMLDSVTSASPITEYEVHHFEMENGSPFDKEGIIQEGVESTIYNYEGVIAEEELSVIVVGSEIMMPETELASTFDYESRILVQTEAVPISIPDVDLENYALGEHLVADALIDSVTSTEGIDPDVIVDTVIKSSRRKKRFKGRVWKDDYATIDLPEPPPWEEPDPTPPPEDGEEEETTIWLISGKAQSWSVFDWKKTR
jgi:hypothetical protein